MCNLASVNSLVLYADQSLVGSLRRTQSRSKGQGVTSYSQSLSVRLSPFRILLIRSLMSSPSLAARAFIRLRTSRAVCPKCPDNIKKPSGGMVKTGVVLCSPKGYAATGNAPVA